MRRLPLALALAALGATATLTVARSASGLTDDFSVDGETAVSRPCGKGRKYLCYYTTTNFCTLWGYGPDGSFTCLASTILVQPYYRD